MRMRASIVGDAQSSRVIHWRPQPRRTNVVIDYSTTSDASLVVAVGRCHAPALAEIYRRHGGSVLRLAHRLGRDERVAEDVVQEVFLGLWNHPERFDAERGTLRSFLLMKAHGRAVDQLRADRARREREERDHRATPVDHYDLEREVWDMAVADRVQAAMATLSEGERNAIGMAYFSGHSYREVAELLGQPEGTVKSRIRTGLKTLRGRLSDFDLNSASGGQ